MGIIPIFQKISSVFLSIPVHCSSLGILEAIEQSHFGVNTPIVVPQGNRSNFHKPHKLNNSLFASYGRLE